jgi:5-formyltetrahydrofolate cyclo-ligase
MDKQTLRVQSLGRRTAIAPATQAAAAEKIAALFLAHHFQSQVIAAYQPMRAELDPRPLLAQLHQSKKQIVLPALEQNQIVFRLYEEGAPLIEGQFGILEPTPDSLVLKPELVLLPCLAFDRKGTRLGYGAGHYDRALKDSSALKVGLAFACQELDSIPKEPHDVALDMILTEEGLIKTN